MARWVARNWMIALLGGLLVLAISALLGTVDYLGLGVASPHAGGVSILSAFAAGGADPYSWLWKLVLTAITLSMGFKGGEVTPLFFIGAALGNSLAMQLQAPVDLFAGLGLIAVFAAATNTPWASILMGIELFGVPHTIYFVVACFTAYYASGSYSIYSAQRFARGQQSVRAAHASSAPQSHVHQPHAARAAGADPYDETTTK